MAATTTPTVLICVPSIDRPHPDSQACLDRLDRSGVESSVIRTRRVIIDRARNAFAKAAVDRNADYLLFIDDDMIFEPDALTRLLARDKDIIAGLFFQRTQPVTPLVFRFQKPEPGADFGTFHKFTPSEIFTAEKTGALLECDATGTGFTLIKTDVFTALKADDPQAPWFQTVDRGEAGFMSEDVYFCTRAKECGFRVFVDTSLKVGHIGDYVYGFDDFARNKEQLLRAEARSARRPRTTSPTAP